MKNWLSVRLYNNIDKSIINNLINMNDISKNEYWSMDFDLNENKINDILDDLYVKILSAETLLKNNGIEISDFTLYLLIEYEQQCNLEFTSDLLLKISRLKMAFCISCWQG